MSKNKKQSVHDKTLKRVAAGYKSQDWKVQAAHIPGYSNPKAIYGNKPDLVARKGNKVRIIEVERPSSMKSDIPQRRAFKKFASKSKNIKFRTKITKR